MNTQNILRVCNIFLWMKEELREENKEGRKGGGEKEGREGESQKIYKSTKVKITEKPTNYNLLSTFTLLHLERQAEVTEL